MQVGTSSVKPQGLWSCRPRVAAGVCGMTFGMVRFTHSIGAQLGSKFF